MITALEIFTKAKELGTTKTYADCQAFLNTYDLEAIENLDITDYPKYSYSIWDKENDINGISAQKILEDVPENGEVYLISIDGNLTYLQKHDPTQMGLVAMTTQIATQRAQQIIKEKIQQEEYARISDEVLISMLG